MYKFKRNCAESEPEITEDVLIGVPEFLEEQHFKNRRLFLYDDVSTESVTPLIQQLMYINAQDKDDNIAIDDRNPIWLYIMSDGGDVISGLSLVDTILTSDTPVYTVNMGKALSMAFYISIVGKRRYSLPNAQYLIHDGFTNVSNITSRVRDEIDFCNDIDHKLMNLIITHTDITEEEYFNNLRKDWYMFASQAKKMNAVDYIVGQDCKFADIL